MPSSRSLAFPVSLALLWVAGFPATASAYIDPGNGSYLFQILLGLVLTAVFTLRSAWTKAFSFLKAFFSRLFRR